MSAQQTAFESAELRIGAILYRSERKKRRGNGRGAAVCSPRPVDALIPEASLMQRTHRPKIFFAAFTSAAASASVPMVMRRYSQTSGALNQRTSIF